MREHKIESAREGGEASVRQAMDRAERAHSRHRKNAIAAAVIGAVLLIAVGVLLMSRLGAASALESEAQPAAIVAASPVAEVESSAPASSEETEPADPEPAVRTTEPEPVTTQRLNIKIGDLGYEPSVVQASAKRPITLVVEQGDGCASGFLMPSLDIAADNSTGPATISLGVLRPGTYRFTCGMDMVEGKLVVR